MRLERRRHRTTGAGSARRPGGRRRHARRGHDGGADGGATRWVRVRPTAARPRRHDGGADGGAEGPADGGATPGGARRWRGRRRGRGPGRRRRGPGRARRWRRRQRLSETHRMTHAGAGRRRPPGAVACSSPSRQVRRRVLGPGARCCRGPASWPAPRGFADLLVPGRRRRAAQPARPAYPVPAGGQGRHGLPAGPLHRRRRGRRRDRRPGPRRQGHVALYADGATLVLQGLHRLWPPLIDFARRLGADLRQPVQVNAYLTPPATRASPPTTTPTTCSCSRSTAPSAGASTSRSWPIRWNEQAVGRPGRRGRRHRRAARRRSTWCSSPATPSTCRAAGCTRAEAQGERSLHLTVGVRALTRYAPRRGAARAGAPGTRRCGPRCRIGHRRRATRSGSSRELTDDCRGAARLAGHRRPGRGGRSGCGHGLARHPPGADQPAGPDRVAAELDAGRPASPSAPGCAGGWYPDGAGPGFAAPAPTGRCASRLSARRRCGALLAGAPVPGSVTCPASTPTRPPGPGPSPAPRGRGGPGLVDGPVAGAWRSRCRGPRTRCRAPRRRR